MGFSDGRVSKTTNAGKTRCDASLLKEIKTDPVVNSEVGFAQLAFADESNGWGLTNSGQLYQTKDGGKRWEHLHEELLFEDLVLQRALNHLGFLFFRFSNLRVRLR
jgi:hypothetical protein